MRRRARRLGAVLATTALLLLAVLVRFGSDGGAEQNILTSFLEVRRLDQALSREVLQVRHEPQRNCDLLYHLLADLGVGTDRLIASATAFELDAARADLPMALQGYRDLLTQKADWLEQFVPENATLRNSMRLLPGLVEHAALQAGVEELRGQILDVYNRVVEFSAVGGEHRRIAALERLDHLAAAFEQAGVAAGSPAVAFVGHGRIVLRQKAEVDQLVACLTDPAGRSSIDDALARYQALLVARDGEKRRVTRVLYLLCLVLVLLTGVMFGHLSKTARLLEQSNRDLRREHDHFEGVVKNLAQPLMIFDADGMLRSANPRAEVLLEGHVLGTPMAHADCLLPELSATGLRAIARDPSEAVPRRSILRTKRDGDVPVSLCVSRMSSRRGNGEDYLVLAHDMRPELRAREQSMQLAIANALAAQEKKRAEEMATARKAADDANMAKSQFLANISHEIRTPMNGVLGMVQILLGTQLDAQQVEAARIIESSASALLALINDLLDFAKIEAGKLVLERLAFSIGTPLEAIVFAQESRAAEKGIGLRLLLEPGVPVLIGDPSRIGQIVTNLVGNAIKFTADGGVDLGISWSATGPGRGCLSIAVRDSGIGIPLDRQDAIFEEFSQADDSTTRRFGGTGLGLSIVRRLVQMMRGTIRVESRPGCGSTFTVAVGMDVAPDQPPPSAPLADVGIVCVLDTADEIALRPVLEYAGAKVVWASSVAAASERAGADVAEVIVLGCPDDLTDSAAHTFIAKGRAILLSTLADATAPHEPGCVRVVPRCMASIRLVPTIAAMLRGGMTGVASRVEPALPAVADGPRVAVLLVEDTPVNQRVAVAMLRQLGYACDVCANGQEALEQVAVRRYDLVLMDCQMPVMDGYEATRRIRALDLRDPPRIVALTAGASTEDRERCLAAGMDDYLAKPYRREELERLMRRWLAVAPGAPAVAGPGNANPKLTM